MSPAEKAKELVGTYREMVKSIGVGAEGIITKTEQAKRMAYVAVGEILKLDIWHHPHYAEYGKIFWENVDEEISKL